MARAPRAPEADVGDSSPAVPERLKCAKRHPEIEAAIGARIRAARVAAGMSQGALGNAVGISFQQVQKYELGQDRVAVSTLQSIASALDLRPGSFFDEDSPPLAPSPDPTARGTVASRRNAQRIGERIERLEEPALIRRLMALIEAIENVKAGPVENSGYTPDGGKP